MNSFFTRWILFSGLVLAAPLTACGPKADSYIAGTKIARTPTNRGVIDRVEEYRIAVQDKNADSLILMASQRYREDGGTAPGDDDYGYDGLRALLAKRFRQAEAIRYAIRYMRVRYREATDLSPKLAFVDVILDASYTIPNSRNDLVRKDKRDHGQFVLEWVDEQWMFLSGM